MPAPAEPFTPTETAIWLALTSFAPWAALVNVGNRAKPGDPKFIPENFPPLGVGDNPFAMLRQRVHGLGQQNSKAVQFHQTWDLLVFTEGLKTDRFNAVKWQSARALWKGIYSYSPPFNVAGIEDVKIQDGMDAVNAPGQERRSPGWSAVLSIRVQYAYNVTDFITP
jgi:hypothetical protein